MKRLLTDIMLADMLAMALVCPVKADERVVLDVNEKSEYSVKWNEKRDRLLVEDKFVEKCFGANVNVTGNAVDIVKGEHTLRFETGNEFYVMDGLGGRKVGALTEIENGRAYLPLRYICEAFGADVNYNGKTGKAEINTDVFANDDSVKPYLENVRVYDQSTIKITGEKTVYFDPRRIMGEPHDADIIFITHTHNDHYEIDSIRKIMNENTQIVITADGVEQAKADGLVNVTAVSPGMSMEVQGIAFKTVCAYNNSSERQNHKKEYNWVGYIVTINGFNYYSAGDTDFIPEMNSMEEKIDVAFLPVDGKYNMGREEAAQAANAINPKVAIPYHYNNFISEGEASEFAEYLSENIKCAIVTFKMQ